jgi:glycosyltransferase involved in cell wall biosynthesis
VARQIAGVERLSIVQFPWGVDRTMFRPETVDAGGSSGLRNRPGWEGGVIAISTRSWEPNYGVLQLLEGFHLAHSQNPRLRLMLVGDGSQRPDVERMIRNSGLAGVVWLTGVVANEALPNYFRAADLYVSSAYNDGSSISLLEAMATGLPVIVTDRPSNREWIESPSGGRLVPFGDKQAMAAALLDLAALAPGLRREIGMRNRAIVERRADWKRNIGGLFEAYERLVPQGVCI